jgi:cysteine desulfurase
MRIYFDNAATTPILPEVLDAMVPVLQNAYGNPSSIHAEGRATRALLEDARKTVAKAIGASTAEVFFTSSGTESNNMAIKGAVCDLGVRRIITSPTEHHCVLHAVAAVARTHGVSVQMLPVDHQGRVDLGQLEALLAQPGGVKTLVSIMHANNEVGTMVDLEALSACCRRHGALLHTDTVQTVGHFPLNVQQTPVHFLSGSGHKLHGPKGVGFIYINREVTLQPFIDGGSQERNMRGGTENVAGIVGLGVALNLACAEMAAREKHIRAVRRHLAEQLTAHFEDIRFNGAQDGQDLYTVLSVSFPASPKNDLLLFNLDIAGISCSGGSACTSGAEHGSHVLEAIGADVARKTIRFSFSHLNTLEEVDAALHKLKSILPA